MAETKHTRPKLVASSESNPTDEPTSAPPEPAVPGQGSELAPAVSEVPASAPASEPGAVNAPEDPFQVFESGDRKKIAPVLASMINGVVANHPAIQTNYCLLSIFDQYTRIGTYEVDQIYRGLSTRNKVHDRDVLLLLMSRGGSIEPAYLISKLCKRFARSKFIVCVPRFAKSAATLISLGADEIHMGILGQLGPIDPQVDDLPALAVPRALEALAELAERHPKASPMLSDYLKEKLAVQQIGYYERVAESAVQYGQRLLSTKAPEKLAKDAASIAKSLVHEYKDHGFVIDAEESQTILGRAWVLTDTPETAFADDFYLMFDFVNYLLQRRGAEKSKLAMIGSLHVDDMQTTTFLM